MKGINVCNVAFSALFTHNLFIMLSVPNQTKQCSQARFFLVIAVAVWNLYRIAPWRVVQSCTSAIREEKKTNNNLGMEEIEANMSYDEHTPLAFVALDAREIFDDSFGPSVIQPFIHISISVFFIHLLFQIFCFC